MTKSHGIEIVFQAKPFFSDSLASALYTSLLTPHFTLLSLYVFPLWSNCFKPCRSFNAKPKSHFALNWLPQYVCLWEQLQWNLCFLKSHCAQLPVLRLLLIWNVGFCFTSPFLFALSDISPISWRCVSYVNRIFSAAAASHHKLSNGSAMCCHPILSSQQTSFKLQEGTVQVQLQRVSGQGGCGSDTKPKMAPDGSVSGWAQKYLWRETWWSRQLAWPSLKTSVALKCFLETSTPPTHHEHWHLLPSCGVLQKTMSTVPSWLQWSWLVQAQLSGRIPIPLKK